MAERDVLSQEEIDALLRSVDDQEEGGSKKGAKPTDKATSSDAGATSNPTVKEGSVFAPEATSFITGEYDDKSEKITTIKFTGQEGSVKGKLPVLDKIYDRAARLFTTEIYSLTAKDFEVKQEPLLVVKHNDFMSSLPNPSLMGIYKFLPLRGKGVILFDSIFIYDFVDYYFGGSSQFYANKKRTDYTATELGVMDLVARKLVGNLQYAWSPIINLNIVKYNDETNPQLINLAEPEEMLLVARFNINFGKEYGSFYFIIPYSMVESIKQQLEVGASRSDDEIDPNWIKLFIEEIMDVELTVSVAMAHTKGLLSSVTEWKSGDFIPMDQNDTITLDIEGIPSFTGSMGTAHDKRAVQIIEVIKY
jgi:flagellar motor switch protein FliM